MLHSGKVAIVDLDDTVGGLRFVLEAHLNKMTGQTSNWENWSKLDVETIYGITNDHFLEVAGEHKLLEASLPHPEAPRFMRWLVERGIVVKFLTARSWHPRAEAMTADWLRRHKICFDEIIVCSIEDDKADYIRHMDNVLFTVDDSVRHCNNYSAMPDNRPEFVFAYEMPWNRNVVDQNVIPIKDLFEIQNHIEGL